MRKLDWVALILVAVLSSIPDTSAQAWPQRPVKIVVPFPAGGNIDVLARVLAQRFSDTFGQPFLVENRPGAAGAIAAEAVARSAPDGYTLFMATVAQIAIVPAVTKTTYDPVKDFAPISNIATNPFVLVVHSGIPARSLAEFIDHVRSRPKTVTHSTVPGGTAHLAMAVFQKRAGLDMVPVVYKGGPAQMADILAGHVSVFLASLSDAIPHAASRSVRLMAVSSERRVPQLPDVPTLSESGFPGFSILTWNGLLAPAGTPKDIIDRIAKDAAIAMKEPGVADRLAKFGVTPLANSPEQFAAQIPVDMAMWAEAIRIAGGPQQ
jgi:tripartite-type tricarboxylate transporter receptor subunit TctC